MAEKTTGYILLTIGLLLMTFATIQIVLVFTGRAKPMEIFNYDSTADPTNSFDPQALMQQFQNPDGQTSTIPSSFPNVQLIDPKALNDILNLAVYFVIMQFLLSMGFKLASLGIQLLRPIVVQMKNRTLEQIKEGTHIN